MLKNYFIHEGVVSFAEEEGSRFPYSYWGSKNLVAMAKQSDVENIVDSEGIKFTDAEFY